MSSDDSLNSQSNEQNVNKEQINAYVDDQLSTEVKAEMLKKSQDDDAIADAICQTQVLKGMVKLAYQSPPDKSSEQNQKKHHRSSYWQTGIAASVLLLIGIFAGWYGAIQYSASPVNSALFQQVQVPPDVVNEHQVLLHISTDEPPELKRL